MKLFTNKKIMQKMTIVLVILMLFNFIVPNYSNAGVVEVISEGAEAIGEALAPIINVLLRFIGDSVLTVLQKIFIGTDPFQNDEIKIALSPGRIFSGLIYTLDIDFLSNKEVIQSGGTVNNTTTTSTNIDFTDKKWYKKYTEFCKDVGEEAPNNSSKKSKAYQIVLSKLPTGNNEDIVKTMDSLSKCITISELLEWFEPEEGYEDGVEEEVEEIIDGKFGCYKSVLKIIDYYKDYKDDLSDSDPSLYEASKPENAPAYVLHDIIATWYKIMRNIAIVFLLSILVYVGIRIMLSSTATDSSKYKKMLVDWVVAICILFVLHYIMAFAINITEVIVDAFTQDGVTVESNDEIMCSIRDKATANGSTGLGYTVLYIVLIAYTIYFLFYYVKRVVYIAFLTLIAPLVALTYPIDKMGDSKAQAFEMWLREYIMNVIIQPVHLIIYTVMVSSSIALATVNPIYAIVVIGAMIPAENFIKEMFGLDSKRGPKGGFLAGATAMGVMQKAASKKPPQFGHHPGENGNSGAEKLQEKQQKPRLDGERQAELSRSVTGSGKNTASENSNRTTGNNSTENKPDIDDGNYQDSRTNMDTMQNDDLPKPEDIKLDDIDETNSSNIKNEENNIKQDDLQKSEDIKLDDVDETNGSNIKNEDNNIEQEDLLKPEDIRTAELNEKNASNKEWNTGENIGANTSENTAEEPKKKSLRRAAIGATAGHYVRKVFNGKNARKLGRGLVKAGIGAVTAGTGAALGLAVGVATGDASKAFQYATAGTYAGYKIGANTGDGIANLAGGVMDIRDTYKAQKNEIIKHDKKAQEAQLDKENRKYANSLETKAKIKKRYGKLSSEEMKKRQEAIVRYRNNGVEDLDIIFNSYNLEQGKDYDNNDIGKELSPDHAMYIAQMASRMDDSDSSRKSVENSMQAQFTENYINDGMDMKKASEQAKIDRKREMQYIDMAKGKTKKEAESIAMQAEINKFNDDSKEEKAARVQAQAIAEANRSKISEADKAAQQKGFPSAKEYEKFKEWSKRESQK